MVLKLTQATISVNGNIQGSTDRIQAFDINASGKKGISQCTQLIKKTLIIIST